MQRPLCYTWKRCEVSSLRKREPSQEMDLCLTMFASPNAEVHGVLMILSPMKPEKMFDTIAGTFVIPFYPLCEPPSPDIVLSSHFARANALQYTDVILTLLHCFIKCDGTCMHRYRYYVSITIVQSYTRKYHEFAAVVLLQV